MFIAILLFLMGDVYFQSLSFLPPAPAINISMTVTGFCLLISIIYRHTILFMLALCMLGYALSGWHAYKVINNTHEVFLNKIIAVEGVVTSIPTRNRYSVKSNFKITRITYQNKPYSINLLAQLTWPSAVKLVSGGKYRLFVRLFKNHGSRNPAARDYEKWLYLNGVQVKGIVNKKLPIQFLGLSGRHYIYTWRQKFIHKFNQHLPDTAAAAWLSALITGDRSQINPADWQVLQKTGTNHLMAIAGLHVGLVGSLVMFVVMRLWRLSERLVLTFPTKIVAYITALISIWAYACITGLSIPTQRACIMYTCFIAAEICRAKLQKWRIFTFALLAVLIYNPAAVLSASFILSFSAIAILIYGFEGRLKAKGIWYQYFHAQWMITIIFTPITLVIFQQLSLVAFFVNLVAIPAITSIILPISLFAAISLTFNEFIADTLIFLANLLFSQLWEFLLWFADFDYAVWQFHLPYGITFWMLLLACLILTLPKGTPGRLLAVFPMLPFLTMQPAQLHKNHFTLTLLDVGQALSVVVQTRNHNLLYDTGLRYENYTSAQDIIRPFLLSKSITRLDMLLVSHSDNDHAGGVSDIQSHLNVNTFVTSDISDFVNHPVNRCVAGQSWQWDGVNFTILHPGYNYKGSRNNRSCVLLIYNNNHRVLLAGDIEKQAEYELINQFANNLQAELLIAPHHGSKTSSSRAFLQAVHPLYVIFSTGYRNKYRMPHKSVIRRYDDFGILALNTVDTGSITFHFEEGKRDIMPITYRNVDRHYWNSA